MDLGESEINLLRSSNLYVPIWTARSEQTKRVLTTLISSRKSYYQRLFLVSKSEKNLRTSLVPRSSIFMQIYRERDVSKDLLHPPNITTNTLLYKFGTFWRTFPHLSIFTRIQRNLCQISYKIKNLFEKIIHDKSPYYHLTAAYWHSRISRSAINILE